LGEDIQRRGVHSGEGREPAEDRVQEEGVLGERLAGAEGVPIVRQHLVHRRGVARERRREPLREGLERTNTQSRQGVFVRLFRFSVPVR
jgi:hypothetical protein